MYSSNKSHKHNNPIILPPDTPQNKFASRLSFSVSHSLYSIMRMIPRANYQKSRYLPIMLILFLAMLNLSVYIICSWMIRPIGDDYVWLHHFHDSKTAWLPAVYDFFVSQNGRYAQNLLVAIPYALLGANFLRLSAIISIGLFFTATYLSLRALESMVEIKRTSAGNLFAFGAILLMCVTSLSVTYDFIRGDIDNSFQYILYYPGIVTYTIPALLATCLVSLVVLARNLTWRRPQFILLAFVSYGIGLFGETVPILYLFGLGVGTAMGFILKKHAINNFKLYFYKFLTIGFGFLLAIATTYLSPAGFRRRALIAKIPNIQDVTLLDIINGSVTGTINQINFLIQPQHMMGPGILLVVLTGFAVAIAYPSIINKFSVGRLTSVLIICLLSWVTTIYVSTFLYTFGYQSPGTVTPPRMEILNIGWLVVALIVFGILLFRILPMPKNPATTLVISSVLCLLILFHVPYFMRRQVHRVTAVSTFSQAWNIQDASLRLAAEKNVSTVTLPVIDIGDSFNIVCKRDGPQEWLSLAKQEYYNIPEVCGQKP